MKSSWSPDEFLRLARDAGTFPDVVRSALHYARQIQECNPNLPVIFTLAHLAELTRVPLWRLDEYICRRDDPYRVFLLKRKTRGGSGPSRRPRTICVPEPFLMRAQKWIAQTILSNCDVHEASRAYAPGNNIFHAARPHCGCRWLLKMDVLNFFESISEVRVYKVFEGLGYPPLLCFQLARICTRVFCESTSERHAPSTNQGEPSDVPVEFGVLPQGAPTSPMLANLCVSDLDGKLTRLVQKSDWTYTRYADDLSFSTRQRCDRGDALRLVTSIRDEIWQCGLRPNEQKTSLTPPGSRKIVLGLLVDTERPRLSKKFRNNLETHIYALTSPKIGFEAHMGKRGFNSRSSMIRHILGLLAHARSIDPYYADGLYSKLLREAR